MCRIVPGDASACTARNDQAMLTRAAVLALFAALAAALPATPAAAAERCPHGAQCAQLTVPLDHTGATPGSLTLAYARIPATGTATGTLVALTGGPGQPGIPFASQLAGELASVRSGYDLVVPDMRGTGDSSAVHCGSVDTAAEITACGEKLGGLRPFLSTAETAQDLENLRAALGVPKLTLYGVSYGTKVAAEYARRFPAQTAGLILDSAVPVDGLDATSQLPQLALARMLREVCRPAACHRTVGDPGVALAKAAARVRRHLVLGPVVAPNGRHRPVLVSQRLLYAVLGSSDLSPALRSGLPAALKSLEHGDAAPLLHLATLPSAGGDILTRAVRPGIDAGGAGVNSARFLATACIEGRLPWDPASPVAGRLDALHAFGAAQAGAFAPFNAQVVLADSTASLCASWPPTPAPPAVPVAGPDVPVLILSGRDDLRTPLEDEVHQQQTYPHAQLLDVPDVGHDVLGADFSHCADKAVAAFLAGQAVAKCTKHVALPPAGYLPATIAHLRAVRPGGRAGRTLRALALSLTAVEHDSRLRVVAGGGLGPVPGLRAGWARLTRHSIALHGYSLFRGMRVTGTLRPAGTLTVSGPGAADGRVTFTRHSLLGTLGGVVVRRG
jgi:pimeloyl-ACP methyl ester carboxylesterase